MDYSLLLMLAFVFALCGAQAPAIITCNATPCNLGEPASITCSFGRHINHSGTDIVVTRYCDADDPGTDVLRCKSTEGEKFDCKTEPGYEFDRNNIADSLTLQIPSPTKDMGGFYKCQLVGDQSIACPCPFSVQGGKTKGTTEQPSSCQESGAGYCHPLSTIITCILLLLLMATTVLVFIRRRRIWPNICEGKKTYGRDKGKSIRLTRQTPGEESRPREDDEIEAGTVYDDHRQDEATPLLPQIPTDSEAIALFVLSSQEPLPDTKKDN